VRGRSGEEGSTSERGGMRTGGGARAQERTDGGPHAWAARARRRQLLEIGKAMEMRLP